MKFLRNLEILPSGNEGENKPLHKNIPIAKALNEETIYIYPSKNDDVTDEDSGDETDVRLFNLPGKHLWSEEINSCNVTPTAPSFV